MKKKENCSGGLNLVPFDGADYRPYYYGGGEYAFKEELTLEVLRRFPTLKIILAHFFFLSEDYDRISRLMEEYPNLCLDIVSGTEMYFNFSQDPDRWRKFFIKYQDRILYGTDNANLYEVADIENAQITCRMQEHFLLGEGELSVWDKKIQGIHLPREAAEKILGGNFLRLAGPSHSLNHAAAARYLQARLNNAAMKLTEEEQHLIREVKDLL